MIDNNDSKACRIRGHLTIHGHLDELENNNSRKKKKMIREFSSQKSGLDVRKTTRWSTVAVSPRD